jgi:hypothetical protein
MNCGAPQFAALYLNCHCVPAVPNPAAIEAVAAAVQVMFESQFVKAVPEAFHVSVVLMAGVEEPVSEP